MDEDLFDFGAADGPPLPDPGWYRLECAGEPKAPVIERNKNDDGYNLVTNWVIVDSDEENNGFGIKNWDSLKPQSLWSTKASLESVLQTELTEALSMSQLETMAEQMEGKTVLAFCKHNTFNGRTNLQIDRMFPDDDSFEGEEGVFFD